MKRKKILYSFLLLISFTSCVSEKELLSKYDITKMHINENINTTYENKNLTEEHYNNLPDLFRKLYKIKLKEDSNRDLDSLTTVIEYNGQGELIVSFNDTSETKQEYVLRVKNNGNYLSVRRKLKLIPIPFVFIYKNRKAIIFNDQEDNLHIINGESQFIWIFITGGSREIYENSYKIEK